MKTVLKTLQNQLVKVTSELSKVRKEVNSQDLKVSRLAVEKEDRLSAARKNLERAVFELERLLAS